MFSDTKPDGHTPRTSVTRGPSPNSYVPIVMQPTAPSSDDKRLGSAEFNELDAASARPRLRSAEPYAAASVSLRLRFAALACEAAAAQMRLRLGLSEQPATQPHHGYVGTSKPIPLESLAACPTGC